MSTTRSLRRLPALLALVSLTPLGLTAQSFDSNLAAVTLNADRGESLTVTLTGVSSVGFDIAADAPADGDAAVQVLTEWKLRPSRTTVQLWGYFADAAAALTDSDVGAYSIPSSSVFGRVASGSVPSFAAFTETGPFGGAAAALKLFEESIAPPVHHGDRTDDLELRIDPTGLDLPGGLYGGTLTLRATAF